MLRSRSGILRDGILGSRDRCARHAPQPANRVIPLPAPSADQVKRVVGLRPIERPVALMPVGRPR